MLLVCLGRKIIQVYSCQVSEKNKTLLLFVKEKCPGGAWPTDCLPGSQTQSWLVSCLRFVWFHLHPLLGSAAGADSQFCVHYLQ